MSGIRRLPAKSGAAGGIAGDGSVRFGIFRRGVIKRWRLASASASANGNIEMAGASAGRQP
jgi:hypothetical protein